jgi:predicted N-formylglutamate amidohydrolase
MKCIVSCEHASKRVPRRFAHLFKDREKILASHQGYDHGAAALARRLAQQLHAPVHLGTISRLLIDLNRSPSNRKTLYTPFSRKLKQDDRELLLHRYYLPYRDKVDEAVAGIIDKGKPVLHISVHSFAPVKSGKVRKADIGLLYDPARRTEKDISRLLAELLHEKAVFLRVRRNYPYLGKTDGFTSFMRRKYPAKFYAGIEIEMNQALLLKNDEKKKTVEILTEGLKNILKIKEFSQLANINESRRILLCS